MKYSDSEHSTAGQLAILMQYDFDRYPLPYAKDTYEERKLLWLRDERLDEIADRYYRRYHKNK